MLEQHAQGVGKLRDGLEDYGLFRNQRDELAGDFTLRLRGGFGMLPVTSHCLNIEARGSFDHCTAAVLLPKLHIFHIWEWVRKVQWAEGMKIVSRL